MLDQVKTVCVILLAGLSSVFIGCSSEDKKVPGQLHAVSGVVTVDGQKVPGVQLNFLPDAKTKGTGGYAVTDAEGAFTVTHYSNTPGIEPGTYNVTFSKVAMPDGSPIPEGKTAADVGAVETLPAHLTQVQAGQPGNVVTVNGAVTDLKYDLKTK